MFGDRLKITMIKSKNKKEEDKFVHYYSNYYWYVEKLDKGGDINPITSLFRESTLLYLSLHLSNKTYENFPWVLKYIPYDDKFHKKCADFLNQYDEEFNPKIVNSYDEDIDYYEINQKLWEDIIEKEWCPLIYKKFCPGHFYISFPFNKNKKVPYFESLDHNFYCQNNCKVCWDRVYSSYDNYGYFQTDHNIYLYFVTQFVDYYKDFKNETNTRLNAVIDASIKNIGKLKNFEIKITERNNFLSYLNFQNKILGKYCPGDFIKNCPTINNGFFNKLFKPNCDKNGCTQCWQRNINGKIEDIILEE